VKRLRHAIVKTYLVTALTGGGIMIFLGTAERAGYTAPVTGVVPFNPASNRVFVRFKDAGNVTRGSTSVAVMTQ
jgi:hypothetical protein